jgi:hypothetical protein
MNPKRDSSFGSVARRWLKTTSNRTFVLYPALVAAFEFALRGRDMRLVPWGVPLLIWGYLQYRLCGNYRTRLGGGGPGLSVPPERIVDTGVYAYLRNPMYLGHMIFLAGLAITFWSWAALLLLLMHIPCSTIGPSRTKSISKRSSAGHTWRTANA